VTPVLHSWPTPLSAYTFASPCFGYELKARVATSPFYGQQFTIIEPIPKQLHRSIQTYPSGQETMTLKFPLLSPLNIHYL